MQNKVEGLIKVQFKDAMELTRARKTANVVGNTNDSTLNGSVVAESRWSKRAGGCVENVSFKARQCHAF